MVLVHFEEESNLLFTRAKVAVIVAEQRGLCISNEAILTSTFCVIRHTSETA